MDRDLIKSTNNRSIISQGDAQSNTGTLKRKKENNNLTVKLSEEKRWKKLEIEIIIRQSQANRERKILVVQSRKCWVIFWWLLTSSEMSSLLGKFWLTAAREACSMSRIHLLMLSIDESHSRWPGALSLRIKWEQEKRRNRAVKWSQTKMRVKLKDDVWKRETNTERGWEKKRDTQEREKRGKNWKC